MSSLPFLPDQAARAAPLAVATGAPTLTAFGPLTGWRHLWLKFVSGFDPEHHCQRCLRGWTMPALQNRLRPDTPVGLLPGAPGTMKPWGMSGRPLSTRYDALYLCGVHDSWDWSKNLHLVALPAFGEVAELRASTGTVFRLNNARAVAIPDLPLDYDGRGKEFTTCRNWRFGVAYYGLDPTRRAFDPLGQRGALPARSD